MKYIYAERVRRKWSRSLPSAKCKLDIPDCHELFHTNSFLCLLFETVGPVTSQLLGRGDVLRHQCPTFNPSLSCTHSARKWEIDVIERLTMAAPTWRLGNSKLVSTEPVSAQNLCKHFIPVYNTTEYISVKFLAWMHQTH